MIQSKLRGVITTKPIKGTGYHLDILIAGNNDFSMFSFVCNIKIILL